MSFSQREIDIWRGQAEEYALECRNQFMKALQGGRRPLPLGQGLPAAGPPPQSPGMPPVDNMDMDASPEMGMRSTSPTESMVKYGMAG